MYSKTNKNSRDTLQLPHFLNYETQTFLRFNILEIEVSPTYLAYNNLRQQIIRYE
jgi:hypothetical protein